MTIVLQNRFWDLMVDDERFSVGLSFNQVPSKLVIPYSAITGFHDPAVNFELRFQAQEGPEGPEPHDEAENDGPTVDPGRGRLERRLGGFQAEEVERVAAALCGGRSATRTSRSAKARRRDPDAVTSSSPSRFRHFAWQP